ncbi:MAG TPA: AraC family ligand binding domain-containing protein, partial [Verrucomicrobiae bacterium]|nr:AraC family ligand binding domain-containing protein [Verrucomicrobiae bacterium]
MKPLIQKIPLAENNSFVARTFRTPKFEVGWHQHAEYELILFTEGCGLSFVGNDVRDFHTGDCYLLGPNLPHTFQKRSPDLITSAVVVQFREDCLGRDFFRLPETRSIAGLLTASKHGLKFTGATNSLLTPLIKALETAIGFQRILLLGQCLEHIATAGEFIRLSLEEVNPRDDETRQTIDRIFTYTLENFREPITLSHIAGLAC